MNAAAPFYPEQVRYLYGLQKFGIKFGLSQTANLLEALGNPQKGRNFVHIGGSNGKGSVAAFAQHILMAAGYRVGLYSSPHLLRFTERFKINHQEMEQERAAELIEELRGVFAADEPPTFFEATTAMALLYFAREQTDIAIMEVGMGGRLDATNVIDPLVSVITNISVEHEQYLGSRTMEIAREKAGIIKPGVDVITGVTQPGIISFFEAQSRRRGAPLWRIGKEIRYRTTRSGLQYRGLIHHVKDLRLSLGGRFQGRNASMAVAVVERLQGKGFPVRPEHIRHGLAHTVWPGRMQKVADHPTILLDGAHNPGAMEALREAILKEFRYRRLILVIGIMEDKSVEKILKKIVPVSDYVIYTRPVYSRAADPERLKAAAAVLGRPGEVIPALDRALDRAKAMADPQDLIVVSGSLFTVGEALPYFDPEGYRADPV